MNSWIKVLKAFRNGAFSDYNYGLTPRFIIGACQVPIGKKFDSEVKAKEAAKKMFNEMKVYNEDGLIVTSNICGMHDGPVMCLTDTKWTENAIGTRFEKIWDRYGSEIIAGDYHLNTIERQIVERIFA